MTCAFGVLFNNSIEMYVLSSLYSSSGGTEFEIFREHITSIQTVNSVPIHVNMMLPVTDGYHVEHTAYIGSSQKNPVLVLFKIPCFLACKP